MNPNPASFSCDSSVRHRHLAAGAAYPQIAAAHRAAAAAIERGHLPGVPVSAHVSVPVAGLREFLIEPARTHAEIDAAWAVLIDRARREADWQLVALGVVAPRLVQISAHTAARVHASLREEIGVAVLAGFTEALLTMTPDPGRGLIVHQLLRRAQAAGQKVVDQHTAACKRHAAEPEHENGNEECSPRTACTRNTPNHPDLALARLVTRGVITKDEADLIGRHRIEGITLRRLGTERGWYPMQTTRALRAAERKVATALGHAHEHEIG